LDREEIRPLWGFFHLSCADYIKFDHLYHDMYLPFVRDRHTDVALIAPYHDHWRWVTRGGLTLVTQADQAVAGMICYLVRAKCYLIEGGVIGSDPTL
jgi:hypothetical protein